MFMSWKEENVSRAGLARNARLDWRRTDARLGSRQERRETRKRSDKKGRPCRSDTVVQKIQYDREHNHVIKTQPKQRHDLIRYWSQLGCAGLGTTYSAKRWSKDDKTRAQTSKREQYCESLSPASRQTRTQRDCRRRLRKILPHCPTTAGFFASGKRRVRLGMQHLPAPSSPRMHFSTSKQPVPELWKKIWPLLLYWTSVDVRTTGFDDVTPLSDELVQSLFVWMNFFGIAHLMSPPCVNSFFLLTRSSSYRYMIFTYNCYVYWSVPRKLT